MSRTGISRHHSYNNRFRTPSSGRGGGGGGGSDYHPKMASSPELTLPPQSPSAATTTATTDRHPLHSVSENMDTYDGSSFSFGQLAFHEPLQPGQLQGQYQRASSYEQPLSPLELALSPSGSAAGTGNSGFVISGSGHNHHSHHYYAPLRQNSGETLTYADNADPARPMAPGKPRRLSRQTSADTRRQQFAASKNASSGEGGNGSRCIVTSADSSGYDDVFAETGGRTGEGIRGGVAGDEGEVGSPTRATATTTTTNNNIPLYDSSLFPSKKKKRAEVTFSTSSASSAASSMASILHNNPYNGLNHRIHDCVWCCNCLYFVFFCCLPAVHYMEQSDVEYNRNNTKRARTLGRLSTLFFVIGTVVTLTLFGLLFFLAIFFSVY